MSKRPLLEHMSLDPEVQDPSVTKDIRSIFQLLQVIEERREKRMETTPSGEVRLPPPLQIMAGYADGKVDSWDLGMEISKATTVEGRKKGFLTPKKGNAKKFLDQALKKKASETGDAAKAKSIYDRIDLGRVYPQMEREALDELRRDDVLHSLLRKCSVQYDSVKTAAVGWDRRTNRFTLHINRQFMVYMSVMNLVNGYPKSTMSSLRDLYKSLPPQDRSRTIMSSTLAYVLKHEMLHIYFQHLGKHMGLYSEFTGQEVNIYGDILINLRITKKMSGKVDRQLVPNVGLGRDQVADGHVASAKAAAQKFFEKARNIFPMDAEAQALSEKFRDEPAKIVLILSPSAFVEIGVNTTILLQFYKLAKACFEVEKPPKVIESDQVYKPPTVLNTPVRPGQVVMLDETGEYGVVVRAGEPKPNPDVEGDFQQEVEVVPKSQLPPSWQEAMETAIEKAGQPG